MSALVFLIILSALILVHEWGHYKAAKMLGIRVEKFSLGFGPKLFSWRQGDTEFMLSAIPLGGYVKMAGDEREKCSGSPEEFYSHPVLHRALVVLMGPVINFVFAYILLFFVCFTGFPVLAPQVGKLMDDYPAQAAGIEVGDTVTAVNGRPIQSWNDLQEAIASSQSETLTLQIDRQGQVLVKTIKPQVKRMKNIFGQEEEIRLIGVQPESKIKRIQYGFFNSFGQAAVKLWEIVDLTFRALYHVVIGVTPAKDALAGPIRIFDVIREALQEGIAYLLYITAAISASLGIFNLFPVPVLDGGHLMFFLIEKIRHRPLSLKVEERLIKVGFSLLLLLMVFVLYNDVIAVGWVDSIQKFFSQGSTQP